MLRDNVQNRKKQEPRGLRNNPDEIWKDVPGYEGLYMVSDKGEVMSLPKYKRANSILLRPIKDKDGYVYVVLCLNNHSRWNVPVHRLVALAFIPNENGYSEIDHINTIPNDNRVENLRWCTHKMNSCNPITRRKKSEAKKGVVFSESTKKKMSEAKAGFKLSKELLENLIRINKKPVYMISDDKVVAWFDSVKAASDATGINSRRISDVCNGKRKRAGGYLWKRA